MALRSILSFSHVLVLSAIGLHADAGAETIRIENGGQVEFYYCFRHREGEPWSKTYELEPGKIHTLDASEPIVVSYWSDKPRFARLQPGGSYRVDDPRRGQLHPSTTVMRPPVSEPAASNAPPPHTAAENAASAQTDASGPGDLRILRLTALADATYRQVVDDWRQRIRDTVAGASNYYEKNFRIRLTLDEIQIWEYKGLADDVDGRVKQVLRISPGQADLLVAFIGFGEFRKIEEEAFYTGHLGLGLPFGQHLLVTGNDDYHVNREIAVLIHELGHVFGAFHVADPRSPMQPIYEDSPIREILDQQLAMDPVSAEIIGLTRDVDFRLGVSSLDPATCGRIKELARSHHHPAEVFAPSPVAMGHLYQKLRSDARIEAPDAPSPQETSAESALKRGATVRVTAESTRLTVETATLAVVPKDATLHILHVSNERLYVAWRSGVLKGWVQADQLLARGRDRHFRVKQPLWTAEEAEMFSGDYLLTTLPRGVRVTVEQVRDPYILVTTERQELGDHKAARLVFEPVIEGWVPRTDVSETAATPDP